MLLDIGKTRRKRQLFLRTVIELYDRPWSVLYRNTLPRLGIKPGALDSESYSSKSVKFALNILHLMILENIVYCPLKVLFVSGLFNKGQNLRLFQVQNISKWQDECDTKIKLCIKWRNFPGKGENDVNKFSIIIFLNALPNNKIFECFELKTFADDNLIHY